MSEIHLKAAGWLLNGETGSSSKAICKHMLFGKQPRADYPSDPSDIGRCFLLLEEIQDWNCRILEMSQYGGPWVSISERWEEIRKCMDDEVGIDWSKGYKASITYKLMKQIIADGYRNDKMYECRFYDDGSLMSAILK